MTARLTEIDRNQRLQRVLARALNGQLWWRRVALGLAVLMLAFAARQLVSWSSQSGTDAPALQASAVGLPGPVSPDGGKIYCGEWEPSGQSCPGGCLWERECVICDEDGSCEYHHTDYTCVGGGGVCFGLAPAGYTWSPSAGEWVDRYGRPLDPD